MVRHGGLTNSYSVPPVDYGELLANKELTDDWDEDAEEYVTLANLQNNPQKKVVWTDPYFDTVGNGWLVSCIGPIYKGSEFIGSVGIDVQLDVILKTVLDITMYRTGHAFLIDTTGNTIAHNELDASRTLQLIDDEEDTDVHIRTLESDSAGFSELLDRMITRDSGLERVVYTDGSINYIGFEKIANTNFILGIVVPEAEVIESVEDTKESIKDASNETFFLIIIINVIALIFILVIGLALANRIVSPINKMINISQQLGSGELDESMFEEITIDHKKAKKDEIGTLMNSFSNMVSSINRNVEEEKKLKQKASAPIPQKLIQDIKIEIKDSVIHRSSIGAATKAKRKPGETAYCLNCGKDLPVDFSGKFCPFCGEEP
jgi:HAMP domain-containing protein